MIHILGATSTGMSQEGSKRGGSEPKFSESDLLDAIRAVAADVDGPLRYQDYREHRTPEQPSGPLIISRIRWSDACSRAGVETNGPRDEFDFTREDCIVAVKRAISSRGGRISTDEYETWSSGRTDVPSLTTVKKRLGSWREANDQALDRLTQ